MNLLEAIAKHSEKNRRQRFRDRRSFYASSALGCSRDQYWEAIGEPQTNHADQLGKIKMMLGSAVEAAIAKEFINDLHWYGIHVLGQQVPVGGSKPNWDGYLDFYVTQKVEGKWKKYVIEFKTKSGYGADLLKQSFEPSMEYLAQLGLYLKDLDEKGETNEGMLVYALLSDRGFGELLQIDCRYEKETKEIVAFRGSCSDGTVRDLDIRLNIQKVLDNWTHIDKCIEKREVPKPDYQYKYTLTEELLSKQSDATILKMLKGQKVIGDWQVIYSRYFDKQLEVDGIERGYTEQEIAFIRSYYKTRHPKSKS